MLASTKSLRIKFKGDERRGGNGGEAGRGQPRGRAIRATVDGFVFPLHRAQRTKGSDRAPVHAVWISNVESRLGVNGCIGNNLRVRRAFKKFHHHHLGMDPIDRWQKL